MYRVHMEHECGCFQRSEYASEKTFENQQDAYNYANIVTEFINEEFCGKHLFFAQKSGDNEFMIRVAENPNASGNSCSTAGGSCGTSCGC